MDKKHSWRKAAAVAMTAAAAALIVLMAVKTAGFMRSAAVWVEHLRDSFAGVSELFDGYPQRETLTLLIYGIDAGEWAGGSYRSGVGRADTIVLLQLSSFEKRASLLSIPRDTLVEIPGRAGNDKINHSYAYGEAGLLRETVEQFTGVDVDYHVGLNYLAFKDIVDLLGGVEFEVDRVIRSRGLTLEPGMQVLDGDQAFAVVSARQDPMGDIDRIRRQQRFIKAVSAEARERTLDEVFYVIMGAWKHLDTDINLAEALTYYSSIQGLDDEDVTMALVPGTFYNRGGISYWRPYPVETDRLVDSLFLKGGGGGGD